MFVFHLLERYWPLELVDSDHLVGKVVPIPVFVSIVEFSITEPIFVQRKIAGFPGARGHSLADVSDAGMRSSPIKPDSFRTRFEAIFSELVILPSVSNLGHVGVLHR